MKVGIVTVTYNSRSVLEDFFASLEKQTHTNHALYIVDSGSTDDTVAYVRAHLPERCRFLQNSENIGFAAGTNQGIRAAFQDGCTAILALNNDVVFGPELLERLAGALGKYHCDMTTPMMYYYEPKDRIWGAGGSLQPWLGYRNKHRDVRQSGRRLRGSALGTHRLMIAQLRRTVCAPRIPSKV